MNWTVLVFVVLCVGFTQAAEFGTYYKLFNAQSLWNSRPVNPVFAPNVTVPDSLVGYKPAISSGEYSVGVFLATSKDPAVTVYGNSRGLNNVDGLETIKSITIPHWPADVVPATGSDGHCDIVDETTGRLHSFWQLKFDNKTLCWNATQYAWTPLNGYGWGTPDHWYQGARAAGVPTSGGLIRKHDAADESEPMFHYALAMSLAHNGLAFKNPLYVYPATNSDEGAADRNTGKVPEGALLMLPPDFNTSRMSSHPNLKKVAETLKTYGAYVVDQNYGTPFVIYIENGAKLFNFSGWNNAYVAQLELIQRSLRMVTSSDYFLDGNGNKLVQPYPNQNLLSMRGSPSAWTKVGGDATCRYDTWSQSLVYENESTQNSTHQNWSGLGINRVSWSQMKVGTKYFVKAEATGGVRLKIVFQTNQTAAGLVFSATLGDGQNGSFVYPSSRPYMVLYAYKPAGGPGRVRGFLYESDNMVPETPTTAPTGTPSTTAAPSTASPSTAAPGDSSSTTSPVGNTATLRAPQLLFGLVTLFLLCL